MNTIDNLLREVRLFNKHVDFETSANGENFNMFGICGVNHYENTHSSILTEILNPKGTHNFGSKFLQAFIEILKKGNLIEDDFDFNYQDVLIVREKDIKNGRLDILIYEPHKKALLLENKIYAGEQEKQLKRYFDYGNEEFGGNFRLIYLTLQGDESSNTNREEIQYIQLSYSELILDWLDRCIEISVRSPVVRETLIQYSNHIKTLTNNTTAHKMSKELIEKLSDLGNFEAAFTIADNIAEVKNNIVNKTLLPQMHEIAKELNLIFVTEEGDFVNTSWAGFYFNVPQNKNYNIFMEFGKRGLGNLIIGFVPKNELSDTSAFLEIKQKVGGGNKRCAFQKLQDFSNWNAEAMKAILTGDMKVKIKNQIQNLLEKTKGIENI